MKQSQPSAENEKGISLLSQSTRYVYVQQPPDNAKQLLCKPHEKRIDESFLR